MREGNLGPGQRLLLAGLLAGGMAIGMARGQDPAVGDIANAATTAPAESTRVALDRILTFAEADRVTVEVTVRLANAADKARLGLTGIIAEADTRRVIWEGPIDVVSVTGTQPGIARRVIANLTPRLWSLEEQPMYVLTVIGTWKDVATVRRTVRFGFRSFDVRNGQFHLNGRPIFLRGNAYNPPLQEMREGVRDDEAFALAYVRALKQRNINFIRTRGQVWLDACDRVGMLAMTGCFGPPPNATTQDGEPFPPQDIDAAIEVYKHDHFDRDAMHPSVVVHVLSEKMPNRGPTGAAFHNFLSGCYRVLKTWDPSHLIISNAGVGDDRLGDIIDWQIFPGWFTGTFVDYFKMQKAPLKPMPVLFSECVGEITGSEGQFNVAGVNLASALQWGGHAPRSAAWSLAYEAFLAKQAIEALRWQRRFNHNLGGVVPLVNPFSNLAEANTLGDLQVKPVFNQMASSFSPALATFEYWKPNVYAGSIIQPIIHIINDSDKYTALMTNAVMWAVTDARNTIVTGEEVPVADIDYYNVQSRVAVINLPPKMPTGRYWLRCRFSSHSNLLSSASIPLFVAERTWSLPNATFNRKLNLIDPTGKTASALTALHVPFTRIDTLDALDPREVLVVGANAWDKPLDSRIDAVSTFVRGGGCLLLLRQQIGNYNLAWLPVRLKTTAQGREKWSPGMWINPERPFHPVFTGLTRDLLQYWSDPTSWNTSKERYPHVFPVWTGFRLDDVRELAKTAVLANYGRALENIALCEVFFEKGTVIVSGFDCVGRTGLDPVADRLLVNLMQYAASPSGHYPRPIVDTPVTWGDYPTEQGLVVGPLNGFLEHVVAGEGTTEAGVPRQPAIKGRVPFGPYAFDATSTPVPENPESSVGTATFYAQIPPERKTMVTSVRNPADTDAILRITVSGQSGAPASIAAGARTDIRTPLPADTFLLDVTYSGSRSLVLERTAFVAEP